MVIPEISALLQHFVSRKHSKSLTVHLHFLPKSWKWKTMGNSLVWKVIHFVGTRFPLPWLWQEEYCTCFFSKLLSLKAFQLHYRFVAGYFFHVSSHVGLPILDIYIYLYQWYTVTYVSSSSIIPYVQCTLIWNLILLMVQTSENRKPPPGMYISHPS